MMLNVLKDKQFLNSCTFYRRQRDLLGSSTNENMRNHLNDQTMSAPNSANSGQPMQPYLYPHQPIFNASLPNSNHPQSLPQQSIWTLGPNGQYVQLQNAPQQLYAFPDSAQAIVSRRSALEKQLSTQQAVTVTSPPNKNSKSKQDWNAIYKTLYNQYVDVITITEDNKAQCPDYERGCKYCHGTPFRVHQVCKHASHWQKGGKVYLGDTPARQKQHVSQSHKTLHIELSAKTEYVSHSVM